MRHVEINTSLKNKLAYGWAKSPRHVFILRLKKGQNDAIIFSKRFSDKKMTKDLFHKNAKKLLVYFKLITFINDWLFQ